METTATIFVRTLRSDKSTFGWAKRLATQLDKNATSALTDNIRFFYFSDGSYAGVIHKTKEVWEAGE